MADQALYRKYRSRDFTEVVGQDHIVQTLTKSISAGQFTHAYLFTGPRGVGKTSVARLLARALNCTGNPKPCNKCPNCLAALNSSLDVVEIDAASNRSIDSVRDLKEKIALAPTTGQFKIYIIDEVHMLTTEAFNALLKTLEEPPAHAVFVLATTEAHKVPETIISRTQRFNFKPITQSDLESGLAKIAAAEKITIEPGALSTIAEAARGGFRDAISMLDQLRVGDGALTEQSVRDLLGYTSLEEITSLSTAIVSKDLKSALMLTNRLEQTGHQPAQISFQLIEFWRDLMRHSASGDELPKNLGVTPSHAALVIDGLIDVQRSPWPQLALETAIVKLIAVDPPEAKAAPASHPPAPVAKAKAIPQVVVESSAPEPQVTTSKGSDPSPDLWPKVLVVIKSQNNSLSALLQMYPAEFTDDEVTIKARFNFHRDLFLKPANRSLIEAAASKVYGRTIKVQARTDESTPKPVRTKPNESAELVSSALEILGGEIVE
jgi:DNA polymerase-3 subunit gamma/tau